MMTVDPFSPLTTRPQDILVAALKHLGGVAHLKEVASQCAAMGYPQPDPSIRRLFQQFSSDAVWSKSKKPPNADDLFYSVDGVAKASGFWGLRGFAVENPAAYPIPGLKRAYTTLLDRGETTLFNQRGIAYRDEAVVGIQVGFVPGGPLAIDTQKPIPVFQSIGPKGKKRYAELGAYRVTAFEKRMLQLDEGEGLTDSYVFFLEPTVTIDRKDNVTTAESASLERGGFDPPIAQDISDEPPTPSGKPPKTSDPEARRVALERRSKAHHALLAAFKASARSANLACKCTQYADALCNGDIFEMKSLEQDEVSQVRAAIGQLYHYKFIHRNLPGFAAPNLYAVFDGPINQELAHFVVKDVSIGVIWRDDVGFHADPATMVKLPWLFA